MLPACCLMHYTRLAWQPRSDWAARWAQGGAKEYVVQCRDEAEVAGYRQLLDFMHSMGRQLPEGGVWMAVEMHNPAARTLFR